LAQPAAIPAAGPLLDELPDPHLRLDVVVADGRAGQPRPGFAWPDPRAASNHVYADGGHDRHGSSFAFMVLPLYTSLEKLDPALLEAASDFTRARRTFLR
jgi:hypothetical protein